MSETPPRSSRRRYLSFVDDYRARRLEADASKGAASTDSNATSVDAPKPKPGRKYLREYLHWLKPPRYKVAAVFLLAVTAAGLDMIEPLFMRYIIDHVLLPQKLTRA